MTTATTETPAPEVVNDLICEKCNQPETDGDPLMECLGTWLGPVHAGCHAGTCDSRACAHFNGDDNEGRD